MFNSKKVLGIINSNKLFYLITLLILILIYLPLRNVGFHWIDDGQNILISQKIVESLTKFDSDTISSLLFEQGRSRPVYWMIQTLFYVLAGKNAAYHFGLHFLLLFLTSIFIYKSVFTISKNNFASILSAWVFLFSPINHENIHRLGPIEPILAFFISLLTLTVLKKKFFPSVLILGLCMFLKETSVVLLIALFSVYGFNRLYFKKNDIFLLKLSVYGLIILLPVIYLNLSSINAGGYSSNYVFSIKQITSSFSEYIKILNRNLYPLFILSVSTYLFRLSKNIFKKETFYSKTFAFQLFGALIFIGFLLIQTPWIWIIERYLMPAMVGIVLFVGLEINWYTAMLKRLSIRRRKVVMIALYLGLVLYISPLIYTLFQNSQKLVSYTVFIKSYINHIADYAPKNSKVLLNFEKGDHTLEVWYETGVHLNLFSNRNDLEVEYFDINNIPHEPFLLVNVPHIPIAYETEELQDALSGKKYIQRNQEYSGEFYVLTTPINFLKQVVKKTANYIIKKEPFTLDGIKANYHQRLEYNSYLVE